MKLFSILAPSSSLQSPLSKKEPNRLIHFGQDSFSPSKAPLGQELQTLTDGIGAGKITALNALKILSTHYPNLSYHGTPVPGITSLEPRQALWRSSKNEPMQDGAPAVSSTADFRPGLFTAVVRKRIGPTAYYINNRDGSLVFKIYTTPEDWEKFKENRNQTGAVHILNPDGMTVHRQIPQEPSHSAFKIDQKLLEFRSYKPIIPLASVQVTLQDFLEMARADQTIRVVDGKNRPLDLN